METEGTGKGKSDPGIEQVELGVLLGIIVKPHSQWMTVKCIINSAEKVVPALIDSFFAAQLSAEVGQPTLL